MDTAAKYKIISIFEIIIVSLLGAAIPFLYLKRLQNEDVNADRAALNNRPIFFILKSMTCESPLKMEFILCNIIVFLLCSRWSDNWSCFVAPCSRR